MSFRICILSLIFSCFYLSNFAQKIDSLPKDIKQKRLISSSSAVSGVWIGGITALSNVWYDEFDKTHFHSFDDSKDWMQMDKAGHVYSAMHLSEASYRLYKWNGLTEKTSTWVGAGIGFGFQTSLEILDGGNAAWGFSWSDMAANAIGATWFLTQQQVWNEQRLLLKFSYHPTEFAALRPSVLGANFSERFFKDYNGQSYWLSFSPKKFTENWILPSWICFSLGYSVDQKLVGDKDIYVTNGQSFQAKRQYLFSLDLDMRELPIKNKYLKALLRPLHYIKIPFPALILDGNKLKGSWLYF